MSPTFLIVGATGNTGRGVVETLSNLIGNSKTFSGYRILALTRSSNSSAAQKLSKLPHVEVKEQTWTEITPSWLREHEVVRAFIASHNEPTQFADESTFHVAALRAGVKYVVRISTTAANVHPDFDAYYPRTHWAIEAMLSTPEFKELQWTSLQPNVFSQLVLAPAAELIKKVRRGEEQGKLRLIVAADSPVGIVDSNEVGIFAAHLLVQDDVSAHNGKKYVLNGPEDITGNQIVKMAEEYIGTKVEDVNFKDLSFLDQMVEASPYSKNVMFSIRHALETGWNGLCKASTTSKEVLEIAAPKTGPAEIMKVLLE